MCTGGRASFYFSANRIRTHAIRGNIAARAHRHATHPTHLMRSHLCVLQAAVGMARCSSRTLLSAPALLRVLGKYCFPWYLRQVYIFWEGQDHLPMVASSHASFPHFIALCRAPLPATSSTTSRRHKCLKMSTEGAGGLGDRERKFTSILRVGECVTLRVFCTSRPNRSLCMYSIRALQITGRKHIPQVVTTNVTEAGTRKGRQRGLVPGFAIFLACRTTSTGVLFSLQENGAFERFPSNPLAIAVC